MGSVLLPCHDLHLFAIRVSGTVPTTRMRASSTFPSLLVFFFLNLSAGPPCVREPGCSGKRLQPDRERLVANGREGGGVVRAVHTSRLGFTRPNLQLWIDVAAAARAAAAAHDVLHSAMVPGAAVCMACVQDKAPLAWGGGSPLGLSEASAAQGVSRAGQGHAPFSRPSSRDC